MPNTRQTTSPPKHTHQNIFGTISETEEAPVLRNPPEKHSTLRFSDQPRTVSKASLKSSKVSFEQPEQSSDEDSFEERREHFQQAKAKSADHKGILKVTFYL